MSARPLVTMTVVTSFFRFFPEKLSTDVPNKTKATKITKSKSDLFFNNLSIMGYSLYLESLD
jgi:hypothetical protein